MDRLGKPPGDRRPSTCGSAVPRPPGRSAAGRPIRSRGPSRELGATDILRSENVGRVEFTAPTWGINNRLHDGQINFAAALVADPTGLVHITRLRGPLPLAYSRPGQ